MEMMISPQALRKDQEKENQMSSKKSWKPSGFTENVAGKVVPRSKTLTQLKRNRPSESLRVVLKS